MYNVLLLQYFQRMLVAKKTFKVVTDFQRMMPLYGYVDFTCYHLSPILSMYSRFATYNFQSITIITCIKECCVCALTSRIITVYIIGYYMHIDNQCYFINAVTIR